MSFVNGCYDTCFDYLPVKPAMDKAIFTYSQDQLKQIASDVLRFARDKGASDAVVEISEGQGLSVTVRKGKVETIEQNKDKGIGVTVFLGKGSTSLAICFS